MRHDVRGLQFGASATAFARKTASESAAFCPSTSSLEGISGKFKNVFKTYKKCSVVLILAVEWSGGNICRKWGGAAYLHVQWCRTFFQVPRGNGSSLRQDDPAVARLSGLGSCRSRRIRIEGPTHHWHNQGMVIWRPGSCFINPSILIMHRKCEIRVNLRVLRVFQLSLHRKFRGWNPRINPANSSYSTANHRGPYSRVESTGEVSTPSVFGWKMEVWPARWSMIKEHFCPVMKHSTSNHFTPWTLW